MHATKIHIYVYYTRMSKLNKRQKDSML